MSLPRSRVPRLFRGLDEAARGVVRKRLEESSRYQPLRARVDEALVLLDRALVASESSKRRPERLGRLRREMAELFSASRTTLDSERFLGKFEPLLRMVSFFAGIEPPKERDTLFGVIANLQLIDKKTLGKLDAQFKGVVARDTGDPEGLYHEFRRSVEEELEDPVEQAIYIAKEYRNPEAHYALEVHSRRISEDCLTAIVAATLLHIGRIQTGLSGMVFSSLAPDSLEAASNRQIFSQWQRDCEDFVGRKSEIASLQQSLDSESPAGYVMLRGDQGVGKSALSAELARLMGKEGPDVDGREEDRDPVLRDLPWLAGSLFCSGKVVGDVRALVGAIVSQANTLLIDPVAWPPPEADRRELGTGVVAPLASVPQLTLVQGGRARARGDRERLRGSVPPEDEAADSRKSMVGVASLQVEGSAALQASPRLPVQPARLLTEQLRGVLEDCLQRLVRERGRAVLIVDAIDEIDQRGIDLEVFPLRLPPGCHALLTTRTVLRQNEKEKIERRLQPREHPPLRGLVLEDVEALFAEFPVGKTWCQRAMDANAGRPLILRDKLRQLREAHARGESLETIAPEEGDVSLFEQWLSRWEGSGLWQAMKLLAVFEPVGTLNARELHQYLQFIDEPARSVGALRRALPTEHLDQIPMTKEARFRLGVHSFARWLIDEEIDEAELPGIHQEVDRWLASSPTLSGLRAAYLDVWDFAPTPQADREGSDSGVGGQEDFDLFLALEERSGGDSARAQGLLRRAAECGLAVAQVRLGEALIDQSRRLRNPWRPELGENGRVLGRRFEAQSLTRARELEQEGTRWLERAAERDCVGAYALACYLQSLPEQEARTSRVMQLLEKAANEGVPKAMEALGTRLLEQAGTGAERAVGDRWLEQAEQHGEIYLDRPQTECLLEPGDRGRLERRLASLRHRAENGDPAAAHLLARSLRTRRPWQYHIPDTGEEDPFERIVEEANRWDLMAADSGEVGAMRVQAELATSSDNPTAAEEWLRRAADRGDPEAMVELARLLAAGQSTESEPKEPYSDDLEGVERGAAAETGWIPASLFDGEGEAEVFRWLMLAAEEGHPTAQSELPHRLLHGDGVQRSPRMAAVLLEAYHRMGNRSAGFELASRLVSGRDLDRDPARGGALLRELHGDGYRPATRFLASALLGAEDLPADPETGARLLEEMRESDEGVAAELIERLREGRGLERDIGRAQSLEREAREFGLATFAEQLIEGKKVPQHAAWGEEILRRQTAAGSGSAAMALAVRLIDGDGLARDPAGGERILRDFAERGYYWAIQELGVRLHEGRGLTRDEEEAERIIDVTWFENTWVALEWDAVAGGGILEMWADWYEGTGPPPHISSPTTDDLEFAAECLADRAIRRLEEAGPSRDLPRGLEELVTASSGEAPAEDAVERVRCLLATYPVTIPSDFPATVEASTVEDLGRINRILYAMAFSGHTDAMIAIAERLESGAMESIFPNEPDYDRWEGDDEDPVGLSFSRMPLRRGHGGSWRMDPPDEGQFWRNQAEKTRNERKRLAADASGLSELQRLRTHARSGDRFQAVALARKLLEPKTPSEQAVEEALELLENTAAGAGRAAILAAVELGTRFLDGDRGLPRDEQAGRRWLEQAIDRGDPPAMTEYGSRLLAGAGLARDAGEGEKWLRRAAEGGDPLAMRLLGELLMTRADLSADGWDWIKRAADGGDPIAAERLERKKT